MHNALDTSPASETRTRVVLDVRPDIRNGREPFSKIMSTVAALPADQDLCLLAPFEPVPLFTVLKKHSFSHAARQLPSGDWEVVFTRVNAGPAEPQVADKGAAKRTTTGISTDAEGILVVDARGLEPPQPMVRILEALAGLPRNAKLHAITDRRPLHLYAQLEDRGFAGHTEEQSNGSFLTCIERNGVANGRAVEP